MTRFAPSLQFFFSNNRYETNDFWNFGFDKFLETDNEILYNDGTNGFVNEGLSLLVSGFIIGGEMNLPPETED